MSVEIPIEKLKISPLNVRKTLNEILDNEDNTNTQELAADIERNGLLSPLIVRLSGDYYEIIAGQRRYLACQILKMEKIACIIRDVDDRRAEEISLAENIQRVKMCTYDKVKIYHRLYLLNDKNIAKTAKIVSMSADTLRRYIYISCLPDEILRLMDVSGVDKISMELAYEFVNLNKNIKLIELFSMIKQFKNEKRIEIVREMYQNKTTEPENIAKIIKKHEEITPDRKKGSIKIPNGAGAILVDYENADKIVKFVVDNKIAFVNY
jgi:ParB family chromosome partitioning protein